METYIERELDLRLVLSPDRSTAVPARLCYRTDDPYAVHVEFHIDSDQTVRWAFARELLIEGVFRPCGQGDVRVWPTRTDAQPVVCLALSSPDGDALLEAPTSVVASWLERTLRAVPPGGESGRLGMEEGLAALLVSTPKPQPRSGSGSGPGSGSGSDSGAGSGSGSGSGPGPGSGSGGGSEYGAGTGLPESGCGGPAADSGG